MEMGAIRASEAILASCTAVAAVGFLGLAVALFIKGWRNKDDDEPPAMFI